MMMNSNFIQSRILGSHSGTFHHHFSNDGAYHWAGRGWQSCYCVVNSYDQRLSVVPHRKDIHNVGELLFSIGAFSGHGLLLRGENPHDQNLVRINQDATIFLQLEVGTSHVIQSYRHFWESVSWHIKHTEGV